MEEVLHKPKHIDLDYDQLSTIINEKYADNPELREIAKQFCISVSVVFEATGWKDYYEFLVDRD